MMEAMLNRAASSTQKRQNESPPGEPDGKLDVAEDIEEGTIDPITETPEKKLNPFYSFILNVRDRYRELRKKFVETTDKMVEGGADEYRERYEAQRNHETGETPTTLLRHFNSAIETARTSAGIKAGFATAARLGLTGAEFATRMAFMCSGVDIAIKQADYAATVSKQGGAERAQSIENQALNFAHEVKEYFERLRTLREVLPEEDEDKKAEFRQKKIAQGRQFAEHLLQDVDLEPAIKEKILADLERYLDTTVYDPNRPSLLRSYERLTGSYERNIRRIVTKHLETYQKRKGRNASVLMFLTMGTTFSSASYVVRRALAAQRALSDNYDQELVRIPVEQRTTMERMRVFGRAVNEGFQQLSGLDRYRNIRAETTRIDSLVDGLLGPDESMDVSQITARIMQEFQGQADKLDGEALQKRVQKIANQRQGRRQALSELLKLRIANIHRQFARAAVGQMEHVYNQYNINIGALGILSHIDQSVENVTLVRENIGTALETMSHGLVSREVAKADLDTMSQEPQFQAVQSLLQMVANERQEVQKEAVSLTESPAAVIESVDDSLDQIESFAPVREPAISEQLYHVKPNDNLWNIATTYLEGYQEKAHNPRLTIPEAVAMIQEQNHLPNTTIRAGEDLIVLQAENLFSEDIPEGSRVVLSSAESKEYLEKANLLPAGAEDNNLVQGIGRDNLPDLPIGKYVVAMGERYGMRNGSMPEHYSEVFSLRVEASGEATVLMPGQKADEAGIGLDEFLQEHKEPIARVFATASESVHPQQAELKPETWSQRSQDFFDFLQDSPIKVLDREGTYCAEHLAGVLDRFSPHLDDALGITVRNGEGEETGVTVPAPMMAEAIESAGGRELTNLTDFFTFTEHGAKPTELLNSENESYREGVRAYIHNAGEQPFRVLTMLYDHTKIQDLIGANKATGGEPNSHVILGLGEKNLTAEVDQNMTVADFFQQEYSISNRAFHERSWLFEELGIEVNGEKITDQDGWQSMNLHAGVKVTIHDVAINHLFHSEQSETLVMLMAREGSLHPVSVLEPNAHVINEALADHSPGNDYRAASFSRVEAGDTMSTVLAASNYPRDLWMAEVHVLRANGIDPDDIKPGQIIPIYDKMALRDNLEDIYSRAEERIQEMENDPCLHLIRPGETMDSIVGRYFVRADYSDKEWAGIKEHIAVFGGIESQQVSMPGDEYTTPYSVTEYSFKADTVLHVSAENLASIEDEINQTRLSERLYLPQEIPVATEHGIIREELPLPVSNLIDSTVDSHPYIGEDVRAALAMVFANENLREGADRNVLTEAIDWCDTHLVPDFMHFSAQQRAVHKLEDASEYATSRALLKDIAWGIHDNPWASKMLDRAITGSEDEDLPAFVRPLAMALGENLETVRDVSSAGLFQVRANNVVAENGEFNNAAEFVGQSMTFDEFESALRADPRLNTEVAAQILHDNSTALNAYIQAFGDPLAHNSEARILAIVNSYNGGPYKTILGGIQDNLLDVSGQFKIETDLETASGRGTAETQEAFVQICEGLRAKGIIDLSSEQILADSQLLGAHTISFLRSETVQTLKTAGYFHSLLPTAEKLNDSRVTYGNYGLLASRSGALREIMDYSSNQRPIFDQIRQGERYYARSEAPIPGKDKA